VKLIQTVTITGSATGLDFVNIPQNFNDLLIVISARSATNSSDDYIGMRFNQTFAGYSTRNLNGNGSSASSSFNSNYRTIGVVPTNALTANTFGNTAIYIPNYTSSENKTASTDSVSENNATAAFQWVSAFLQTITSPINAVGFDTSASGAGFVAGSTASLYGITKGTDGITTVS
jgi:hypothetical protein